VWFRTAATALKGVTVRPSLGDYLARYRPRAGTVGSNGTRQHVDISAQAALDQSAILEDPLCYDTVDMPI
jgi:hypothetical protein